MPKLDLDEIFDLEGKIVDALKRHDYLLLSELSNQTHNAINKLLSEMTQPEHLNEKDINDLKSLAFRIRNYEEKALLGFKTYTSKVSAQTKMHSAYKKYGS